MTAASSGRASHGQRSAIASWCSGVAVERPDSAAVYKLRARVHTLSGLGKVPADDHGDREWSNLCPLLSELWMHPLTSLVHFAINSRAPQDPVPPPTEFSPIIKPIMNAGDLVLPVAVRWATEYFLSGASAVDSPPIFSGRANATLPTRRSHWGLFEIRTPTNRSSADYINNATNHVLGVVLGGGGLFYPRNACSRQKISGWQWVVPTPMLRTFRPRVWVFGVGYNEFDGSTTANATTGAPAGSDLSAREPPAPSSAFLANSVDPMVKAEHTEAFRRSYAALASRSALIGLRESHSLRHMSARFPLAPADAPKLRYQPCATTLVGAIHPSLATTALLDPSSKVLSTNAHIHISLSTSAYMCTCRCSRSTWRTIGSSSGLGQRSSCSAPSRQFASGRSAPSTAAGSCTSRSRQSRTCS